MRTPTWIYLTAACFLLFGGCGALNNTQSLIMPEIFEMQKEMMSVYADEETNTIDSLQNEVIFIEKGDSTKITSQESIDKVEKMLSITDKQKRQLKTYSYIGIIVSLLFFLTGIFWLIPQKFSINLAYFTIGVGILFSIIRTIFILSNVGEGNVIFFTSSAYSIGAFFHICLLVFILINDRGTFRQYINSH